MTTDVYPRENCLAPDYSMTILTQEREMRGIAHRRDIGEMGVGRDGRVIDLHLLTLGERAGGVEGGKGVGGVVLRGEDARGKPSVVPE